MLEKTMRQVLTKKINEWVGSITDREVQKSIQKDLIITGGCFTSMIQNEAPKDFDCYFRTKETVLTVARYYIDLWNEEHKKQENAIGKFTKVFLLDGAKPDKEILEYYQVDSPDKSRSHMISNITPDRVKIIFPSDGVVGNPEEVHSNEELGTPEKVVGELDEISADEILESEKKRYFPVFMSSNAITLSNGIQVIVRFYGEPDKIHDTFDFIHTKAYWDNGKHELCIPKDVYEHVVNKTLNYTGSKYPVCSIFRVRKFVQRGWTINAGQLLKMCLQVSELNLMDIDVLEDQLIGVDSLYFMNLIQQFRAQAEKDGKAFTLSTSYVISIIDKIF